MPNEIRGFGLKTNIVPRRVLGLSFRAENLSEKDDFCGARYDNVVISPRREKNPEPGAETQKTGGQRTSKNERKTQI